MLNTCQVYRIRRNGVKFLGSQNYIMICFFFFFFEKEKRVKTKKSGRVGTRRCVKVMERSHCLQPGRSSVQVTLTYGGYQARLGKDGLNTPILFSQVSFFPFSFFSLYEAHYHLLFAPLFFNSKELIVVFFFLILLFCKSIVMSHGR